jgi:phosphonate metabolism-associated iron-containing alcohol dehydrogenase
VVLSQIFHSPTRIYSDGDLLENLAAAIGDRKWSLVTSANWLRQKLPDKLGKALGNPVSIIGDVPSNPLESYVAGMPVGEIGEVIVAIGGGSVMDAAKGLTVVHSLNGDMQVLSDHLRKGNKLPVRLNPLPLICVPTTSGTGSEVTRWATIWGEDKIKYSLSDPRLYPEYAILASELCLSMPEEITLSSGLDAVSHSMEAVWNKNHTAFSDILAGRAISILRHNLVSVIRDPDDLPARTEVQLAATLAGLAMSTTQTALCHSISYPFTALFGMPHGLACSFTLGTVSRFNLVEDAERQRVIADAFDLVSIENLPDTIEEWLFDLGIGRFISKYIDAAEIDQLDENLITRARAKNNIREVDSKTAKEIAMKSFQFCTRH